MSNNQTPIPDLSTLDREQLARIAAYEDVIATAAILLHQVSISHLTPEDGVADSLTCGLQEIKEQLTQAESLARMVAELQGEVTRKAEYLRELAKEHGAALDREQQVRNELATARAKIAALE